MASNKKALVVLNTNGRGLYTNVTAPVNIVDISVEDNEVRVYFDRKTWDVRKNDLIYTDPAFLKGLKSFLKSDKTYSTLITNSSIDRLDYTEHGMQGNDYVTLEVC